MVGLEKEWAGEGEVERLERIEEGNDVGRGGGEGVRCEESPTKGGSGNDCGELVESSE